MTQQTLVIGVGYLGQRFLDRQTGSRATGLSRSTGFDLDKDDSLPAALPADYAVLYTVPPRQDRANDVRLERFLDKLDPLPARCVYISTTGVYGDCAGELVDEGRPTSPKSGRAALRVAAEVYLQSWCRQQAVECLILRVPGIYGPGRLGVERVRSAAANIREQEANPGNRIHVDDLVSCCEAALSSDAPAGIYNVGDGDHRSATWFARELARQCGLGPPPEISRAAAEQAFSAARLSFLGESRRIDTQKMHDVLGVEPRYQDAADGIAASLAEGQDLDRGRDIPHRK